MSETLLSGTLDIVFAIFQRTVIRYRGRDMLPKSELADLVREELPKFPQGGRNPEAIDVLFKELDQNKDGELSFEECTTLFSKALMVAHAESRQDN